MVGHLGGVRPSTESKFAVAMPAVMQVMQCMTKHFTKNVLNKFSKIVWNRNALYLCTSTLRCFIYHLSYPKYPKSVVFR